MAVALHLLSNFEKLLKILTKIFFICCGFDKKKLFYRKNLVYYLMIKFNEKVHIFKLFLQLLANKNFLKNKSQLSILSIAR